MICPNCGSKEVSERGMIGRDAYSNTKVCLTCGFQSPLFPEITSDDAKKLPDKPKKFNPSYLPIFSDRYEKKRNVKFFRILVYGVIIWLVILVIWLLI